MSRGCGRAATCGRARAARACELGVEAGRGGGVVVTQRFGGALNLNVHLHALVLDGVFVREDTGALRFHPTPDLTTLDVEEVLATVVVPAGQRDRLERMVRFALRPPVALERLHVTGEGRVRLELRLSSTSSTVAASAYGARSIWTPPELGPLPCGLLGATER